MSADRLHAADKAHKSGIVIAALFLLICGILFFVPVVRNHDPNVHNGVLGAGDNTGIIALNGEWNAAPGKLTPDIRDSDGYEFLPHQWQNALGVGTYFMRIDGLVPGKAYALFAPYQATSFRLYIDGHEKAANGSPGMDKVSTIPGYHPLVIRFTVTENTVQIILQVANFHHRRGGPFQALLFGPANAVERYDFWKLFADIMFSAVFLFVAFIYIFNAFIKKEASVLWIGLLYFFIGLTSLSGTPQVLLLRLFPGMNWSFFQRWCYITTYAIPVCLMMSAYTLFGGIRKYVLLLVCFPFCIIFGMVLIGPPPVFTRLNIFFQGYSFLVYAFVIALAIMAIRRSYPYAIAIFFAYLIFFCSALSSALFANGKISSGPYLPLSFVNAFAGSAEITGFPLEIVSYFLIVALLNIFSLLFVLRNPQMTTRRIQKDEDWKFEEIVRRGTDLGLSAREAEITVLMLQGKNNNDICATLFISLSTVKTHISHILQKTGTKSRIDLFFFFYRNHTADR
ncbi:MAG: hypothetical protein JW874_01790 [Spirochaetales bacterium]|nr:hypothetical protein [Spirochaetales bacterium]